MHVELDVGNPSKLKDKENFLRHFVNICKNRGATNVSLLDSHYWSYKYPRKPKLFEFIIRFKSNIKTAKEICSVMLPELNKYNHHPSIFLRQKDGSILKFSQGEAHKGKLLPLDIKKSPQIMSNTKIVQIITPDEYEQIDK